MTFAQASALTPIIYSSKDAIIRVWDRETLSLHCELRGHEGPVNAVGLQSGRVVSASGDGKMMMWDVLSGKRLRTFDGHDRGLACIEFRDDMIVSGSNDCKIKVWCASTGDCLQTLSGHDLLVRALAFDPESGRLVSASYDRTLKVWDLRTGRMVREFKNSHVSHIFDVKFDVKRIVRYVAHPLVDLLIYG
jgi:F-box and WD-40 domain protein 1/11